MHIDQTCNPTPTGLGFLGQWFATYAAYRAKKREHRINRAAFRNLQGADEAILKDIGVTRSDVEWAAQLPMSQNAAQELQRIALQNRTTL